MENSRTTFLPVVIPAPPPVTASNPAQLFFSFHQRVFFDHLFVFPAHGFSVGIHFLLPCSFVILSFLSLRLIFLFLHSIFFAAIIQVPPPYSLTHFLFS